ncbi:MAG: hypothetical protein KatS3mg105_4525 [Gemmatales bacterium]|nr:MAG: hypothetical protein KatS3mg105_4525 [Gemmatales bacterium]
MRRLLACRTLHEGKPLLFALVLLVGAVAVGLVEARKRSQDVVRVNAVFEPAAADGWRRLLVTLRIQPGWHIYANPVGPTELHDVQTEISPATADTIFLRVDYPRGKVQQSEFLGSYRIYEGTVTIPVLVRHKGGSTGPAGIVVRFQACSDRTCLPPARVRLMASPSR